MFTAKGEVDRARHFLRTGRSSTTRSAPEYWKAWHDFEVAHGYEDTFRDMLRVKR